MSEPTPPAAQPRAAARALLRRQAAAGFCATVLMLQQGCYNAVPVAGATAMPVGEVTIVVNDRGRLLVGNRLGSLLDRVTGRIVRADSLEVEVAVQTAEDVRGSMARWGGERFTIPREGIGSMNEKKLAKRRTGLFVGGVILSVAGLLLGIKAGRSNPGGGPVEPGPPPI